MKKLEEQFAAGKVSKRQYSLEKRVIEDKLDTVLAADRIKRLQGKEVVDEKPLEYWSDKQKEDEDLEEKEALIEKYVTTPKPAPVETKSGMSRGKISLLIFLVVAFFVGTGYGVYVMSAPSNNSSAPLMTVNESAFPIVNNTTNITTNKTSSNGVKTTNTNTNTNTNNNKNTNTNTNTNKNSNTNKNTKTNKT